jgi:hypothetical protein
LPGRTGRREEGFIFCPKGFNASALTHELCRWHKGKNIQIPFQNNKVTAL